MSLQTENILTGLYTKAMPLWKLPELQRVVIKVTLLIFHLQLVLLRIGGSNTCTSPGYSYADVSPT